MRQILVVLAFVFTSLSIGAPANAAPMECETRGKPVNSYWVPGFELVLHFDDPVPAIVEQICRKDELRLFKAVADTPKEVAIIKKFARQYSFEGGLVAVCGDENRAYVLNLAFYHFDSVKRLNKYEQENYEPWLTAYVRARDNCRLYRPWFIMD